MDFRGPKLHFSSTKIIDKKPYPRRGHSKFRLQCDTEVYCTALTNTVMIKASDRLHTHTHTRLTALFPVLPRSANLDFTEARDSEWKWHQLGHMHLAADR